MNPPELEQFAHQLALWTELVIENGRTPFRRVDLYPKLHTDKGILQPPLIFWINRQSMMAGGVLLLPDKNLEQELERGRSCCDALGLKYFITWESDQVRIWRLDDNSILQHQQFTLDNSDHPDAFRHLLEEVLEALKLLAVIGHVANDQLSPLYLHNLFQTTLDLALPPLVDSYRRKRSEDETVSGEDADQLANGANRLLLIQLLGLAWYQLLPTAILPEKLERAIQLSLPQLAEPLKRTLSLQVTAAPPELPLEAAVCFHHLLLRLQQLSWQQPEQRAITSINLLIEQWDDAPQQTSAAEILLYPAGPVFNQQTKLVLSNSPSLLAAASLRGELLQQPTAELRLGNLFQLDLAQHSGLSIHGILNNPRLLTRDERHQYAMLLRTSWPNRRFKLSGNQPLWLWELIHLLGLSKEQRKLSLTLPQAVLKSAADGVFWEILSGSYCIQKVTALENQQINLELAPEISAVDSIQIVISTETRTVPNSNNIFRLRNQLLLALELPEAIYQLLTEKLIWPDEDDQVSAPGTGQQQYLQSQLFLLLEKILQIDFSSLPEELQQQQLAQLPHPEPLVLQELARAMDNDPEQTATVDTVLAELLETAAIEKIDIHGQSRSLLGSGERSSNKKLQDELIMQLQSTGLPTFPDQYLYFLENPEIVTYQFSPPLVVKSELLGEIELEDAEGQKIRIYGEELANALQLCSMLGKTASDLPKDRNQLAVIQQQYWKDLSQINKQLNSLSHSKIKNPKAANKLAKKIWKKLGLPKIP